MAGTLQWLPTISTMLLVIQLEIKVLQESESTLVKLHIRYCLLRGYKPQYCKQMAGVSTHNLLITELEAVGVPGWQTSAKVL